MAAAQPVDLVGRVIVGYIVICVLALVGSGLRPKLTHLGLLCVFAFFACSVIRNMALLGMAAAPLLARHLPRAVERALRLVSRRGKLSHRLAEFHSNLVAFDLQGRALLFPVAWALVICMAALVPRSSPVSYRALVQADSLEDVSPQHYPRGAIQFLQAHHEYRRIFNMFDWGSALLYSLYPQAQVFIDSRNDCYPINVFDDYFVVESIGSGWREILARYQVDAIVFPPPTDLAMALRAEPGWSLVYQDRQAAVFGRVVGKAMP